MRKMTESEVEVGDEVGVVKEVEVTCELHKMIYRTKVHIFLNFSVEIVTEIETETDIQKGIEIEAEEQIDIGKETENIVIAKDIDQVLVDIEVGQTITMLLSIEVPDDEGQGQDL